MIDAAVFKRLYGVKPVTFEKMRGDFAKGILRTTQERRETAQAECGGQIIHNVEVSA
jgi:hypothetical protein